jgi:hypothetical protein
LIEQTPSTQFVGQGSVREFCKINRKTVAMICGRYLTSPTLWRGSTPRPRFKVRARLSISKPCWQDGDFLRVAVKAAIETALEAEMTEALRLMRRRANERKPGSATALAIANVR